MKIYGDENNLFILKEIGNRIKEIRISKSMTQKDLASNAGVAHSTIVRIENGEGANLENLIKIIRILGFAQNFDLLIPEQEMTPEDIFMRKEKRKRVTKNNSKYTENEWIWGDEK